MRHADRVLYLRNVTDHMRSHGAVRFTLYIAENERSVKLRSFDVMDKEVLERTVHRIRRRLNDTPWSIRTRVQEAYQLYQEAL